MRRPRPPRPDSLAPSDGLCCPARAGENQANHGPPPAPRPRHHRRAPQPLRAASRRARRDGPRSGGERSAHRLLPGRESHHPRREREPRRGLPLQPQPVPRVRARVHLLLRPADARVSRLQRRIVVKEDAPALLRATFLAPRWEPQVVALSGNTDCYQPIERRLGLTRRCLEVFLEFRNPVAVVTKSALVARDADVLGALAAHGAAHVLVSVTTLDPELARRMEPRAAQPARRLEALATLAAAGVPVGVLLGPVIPGLNDAEIPRILAAARAVGARSASWVLLRLPQPVDTLFERWLAEHYPERRARVLARIRDTRGGRLSDATFGRRQSGAGEYAAQIAALFAAAARRCGLDRPLPPLSAAAFRRPPGAGEQLRLL